ncbi:MAG: hypothetical protein L0Z62_15105, partial [Gemmataceae bacterium]|nr:hypothetical protein [Gemmataceae bacterium]
MNPLADRPWRVALACALLFGALAGSSRLVPTASLETSSDDVTEERGRAVLRRLEAQLRTAEEVIAGRLTLREAAERFRRLNAEWADTFNLAAQQALQAEGALYRQVLDYVEGALEAGPAWEPPEAEQARRARADLPERGAGALDACPAPSARDHVDGEAVQAAHLFTLLPRAQLEI